MPNVLITAGPTREYIDPIRYISNASSGKMGYEIAKAFVEKGAQVRLVTGPINLLYPSFKKGGNPKTASPFIKGGLRGITQVETAEQMRQAVLENFDWADIIIMAAAVADYRPVKKAKQKLKKNDLPLLKRGIEGDLNKQPDLVLKLEKTPDILGELGNKKRDGQMLVGFALETENLIDNAKKKLEEKNLDFVIANTEKAIDNDSANFFVINQNEVKEYKNISKVAFTKELADSLLADS